MLRSSRNVVFAHVIWHVIGLGAVAVGRAAFLVTQSLFRTTISVSYRLQVLYQVHSKSSSSQNGCPTAGKWCIWSHAEPLRQLRRSSLNTREVPEPRKRLRKATASPLRKSAPILSFCYSFLSANKANAFQTFLLTQLTLSFTPLALFLSFTIGVLALSFISALLFSLFWIGVALLVLVPTLFVTVSLGIVVWIWAVSSFYIAKWVYDMVPVNVRGVTEVAFPNGKVAVVEKTGEGYGDVKAEVRG